MTREEKTTKLAEIEANVNRLVKSYNEAMLRSDIDAATKIGVETDKAVGEYTTIAQDIVFNDCRDSEDPMLTAVKTLSFSIIAVKDEKNDDKITTTRVVVFKDRQIDLEKLHKFCKDSGGIGADKKWIHIAQKMNALMTARKAVDLGLDPKEINDSYAMSNIAKEIDLGKNPVSNTQLLKTLQVVISAMIGDQYKAVSHDVAFLKSVYSKKGKKALSVSCANHRYFYGYLMEICHRIVLDLSYSVEYKAANN